MGKQIEQNEAEAWAIVIFALVFLSIILGG